MNRRAQRRDFLKFLAASGVLAGCGSIAAAPAKPAGRVIVVGGGYGGATAAKYIRMWSPNLEVLMIERNAEFISCPMSNLVLGGSMTLEDITVSYRGLQRYGVQVIRDDVTGIDVEKKKLRLARGPELAYDRLVVAPGVDFMFEEIPGLDNAEAQERILHAWKSGPEVLALRKQLEEMKDGGIFALAIPTLPFRCPPGPYERACQVARYFKRAKPKSRIVILDANEDIASKKTMFLQAWNELYPGIIDYRNNSEVKDIDLREMAVMLDFDTVRADVINILPPMKAGTIAGKSGLVTANDRWCGVDWLSMESTAAPGVHVLGDATLAAPLMPKSGHIANQHGKLAAAAITALMNGRQPDPEPMMLSVCYSYVDDKAAAHIVSVHKYDAAEKTMKVVPGSAGLSAAANEIEGRYAMGWAHSIWNDMLG
jgi:sulfide dehydrogenase [flavocytochrome c] flavoprotein chain